MIYTLKYFVLYFSLKASCIYWLEKKSYNYLTHKPVIADAEGTEDLYLVLKSSFENVKNMPLVQIQNEHV